MLVKPPVCGTLSQQPQDTGGGVDRRQTQCRCHRACILALSAAVASVPQHTHWALGDLQRGSPTGPGQGPLSPHGLHGTTSQGGVEGADVSGSASPPCCLTPAPAHPRPPGSWPLTKGKRSTEACLPPRRVPRPQQTDTGQAGCREVAVVHQSPEEGRTVSPAIPSSSPEPWCPRMGTYLGTASCR